PLSLVGRRLAHGITPQSGVPPSNEQTTPKDHSNCFAAASWPFSKEAQQGGAPSERPGHEPRQTPRAPTEPAGTRTNTNFRAALRGPSLIHPAPMNAFPSAARYDQMTYARVGRSGLKLPRVSLGLWHNFGGIDCHENS